MSSISCRSLLACSLALIACAGVTGCGGGGSALPASLPVPLPGGQSTQAELGTGPSGLANTSWNIHDGAAPNGAAIARVDYGPSGAIVQISLTGDVSTNISGAAMAFTVDEQSHDFFPGVTYVAGSYGGQNGSDVGATVFARMYVGPSEIANLALSIFGTRSGDTINGTLAIDTTITEAAAGVLPGAPVGTQSTSQGVVLKKL